MVSVDVVRAIAVQAAKSPLFCSLPAKRRS